MPRTVISPRKKRVLTCGGRRVRTAERLINSSVMPSAKNSCSGSCEKLSKGNTASEVIREGEAAPPSRRLRMPPTFRLNRSPVTATAPRTANARYQSALFGAARSTAIFRLQSLKQQRSQGYVPASSIAAAYLRLGEKDNAVTWLEKAYEERDPELAWARVEPVWDGLRSEPRFVDLMRRMGFSSILH